MTTTTVASSGGACGCASGAPSSSGVVRRYLPLAPTIALVLLPKCPLCVAAYFGLVGSLGAGSWLLAAWGLPLGAGLLALTLGALTLRARRSRDYRPPLVGLAGAASLLAGQFVLDAQPLHYAGVGILIGATLWSVHFASKSTARPESRSHLPSM
jgi:hypothetical protein